MWFLTISSECLVLDFLTGCGQIYLYDLDHLSFYLCIRLQVSGKYFFRFGLSVKPDSAEFTSLTTLIHLKDAWPFSLVLV